MKAREEQYNTLNILCNANGCKYLGSEYADIWVRNVWATHD